MTLFQIRLRCGLYVALTMALSSCFSGPGYSKPSLAPVSGTVSFMGKPLSEGTIVFHPENGRSAHGAIHEGKIVEVFTYKPGDGVPVGDLKVVIYSGKLVSDKALGMIVKSNIPVRYNSVEGSGLTAHIEAKKDNVLTFDLTK